jgi:hypothetical protein
LRRLAFAFVLTLCAAAAVASPAMADSTWTGASSASGNWSVGANWSGGTAPTPPTLGTLTFPHLSSPACTAVPLTASCYASNNNIGAVQVNTLQIDDGDPYNITTSGGGITLVDGITTLPGSDMGFPNTATVSVPITFGGTQTWTLEGPPSGTGVTGGYLDIADPIAATSDALGVTIGNEDAMALNGDNELGAVSISGAAAPTGCANGDVDLHQGGSLNATNGKAVTLTNIRWQVQDFAIGALTSHGACLFFPTSGEHHLSVGSATFDLASMLDMAINSSDGTSGVDNADIHSTGAINLGGASLSITDTAGSAACSAPVGTKYTLVTATGGITGTFGNAAATGAALPDTCPGSPDEYVIGYTATTVTATLTPAATVALSASPASPVTNQSVTLTATITPNGSSPAGLVDFEHGGVAIAGCGAVALSSTAPYVATCKTSFAAVSAPVALSATLTQGGSSVTPTANLNLTVGKGATTTVVTAPNGALVGSKVTYTTTIAPSYTGAAVPAGTVEFFDAGKLIGACSKVSVDVGAKVSTASCTVSYASTGSHAITAQYSGDGNFTGSTAPATPLRVVKTTGKPSVSRGHLGGVAKRHPKLAFTATAGVAAPLLKTIAIGPVKGLKLSAKHGIVVDGAGGKALKFHARVHKGTLEITLAVAATKAQITIGGRAISVSRLLAREVAGKIVTSAAFAVTLTDASHTGTKLTLRLKHLS